MNSFKQRLAASVVIFSAIVGGMLLTLIVAYIVFF